MPTRPIALLMLPMSLLLCAAAIGGAAGPPAAAAVLAAVTTPPTAPGAPTEGQPGQSYTRARAYRVHWPPASDPERGITAYEVHERAGAAGARTTLTTREQNVYRVRARNGAGFIGPWSKVSSAMLVDRPALSLVTVSDDGDSPAATTWLHLRWTQATDPESAITDYRYAVQHKSRSGPGLISRTAAGMTTETGLALEVGEPYFIGVRARNGAGALATAPYSNGIRGTAPIIAKVAGLNLSPFKNGQDPNQGTPVTKAQLIQRLSTVAPYTEWVRFFGSTSGLEFGPRIARGMGLKVACGAWIGRSAAANDLELANLIANSRSDQCNLAIVGSEVLLRGDQTPQALLAYLARVKQAVPTVPVTTADVYGKLLAHPEVMAAVDVVAPNFYAYWEGIELRYAVASIHANYQRVVAAAGGKPVMVSETGWPSCGNPVGAAVPSPENARSFAINFRSWASTYAIPYFYFEAYDEAWKAKYEGPQGACWGVWTADAVLKPGMEDLFSGVTVPDNWSGKAPPGAPARRR